MMASKRNSTTYTGVRSDLAKRAWQHREGLLPGFTSKYRCKLLVWYEAFDGMTAAIAREKQTKGGSRKRKLELIEAINPQWLDLYDKIGRSQASWVASSPAAPRNDE